MLLGFNRPRWGLAVLSFLAAEASLIAAAVAWVTIYSYLVNPGHPAEFYQQYAQTSSPYIALLAGIPAFLLACRWAGGRVPSAAQSTALAVFGLFCLVEIASLLAFGRPTGSPWFEAVNFPVKLLSCLWGAGLARKPA
jgi:hypothetical protein